MRLQRTIAEFSHQKSLQFSLAVNDSAAQAASPRKHRRDDEIGMCMNF
ncbi:MAG: hypothetical protein M3Y53_08985 [Thermoproteota archaeon]|nr:hypothetical protein [Thermoproteota archaeon]